MAGKTSRECERALLDISPESVRQFGVLGECARAVSAADTEIKFIASAELMAKFERLRALLAHHGSLTYAQLFDRLADQELKRIDPMRKIKHKQDGALRDSAQKLESETKSETALNAKVDNNSESAAANAAETPRKHRPHIPLAERREVYQRAGGKCEYVDPKTGRRCNSEWALQIDHIQAYGRGGEHGLKNFRLVCCSHNRFLAEKTYGSKFMSRYLRAKSCGEQN